MYTAFLVLKRQNSIFVEGNLQCSYQVLILEILTIPGTQLTVGLCKKGTKLSSAANLGQATEEKKFTDFNTYEHRLMSYKKDTFG